MAKDAGEYSVNFTPPGYCRLLAAIARYGSEKVHIWLATPLIAAFAWDSWGSGEISEIPLNFWRSFGAHEALRNGSVSQRDDVGAFIGTRIVVLTDSVLSAPPDHPPEDAAAPVSEPAELTLQEPPQTASPAVESGSEDDKLGPQAKRAVRVLRLLFPPDGRPPDDMPVETVRGKVNAKLSPENELLGKADVSWDTVDRAIRHIIAHTQPG